MKFVFGECAEVVRRRRTGQADEEGLFGRMWRCELWRRVCLFGVFVFGLRTVWFAGRGRVWVLLLGLEAWMRGLWMLLVKRKTIAG